jgi:exopolyphosphatase/guanosine-5'-triphosphate,3'-diphosphate pyrophosphatase
VVLDALGLANRPPPAPAELRRRSVDRLVRGWGEDPTHVGLVGRIAERIFDGLAGVHGLGDREREWLRHAASLHEIGTAISPARFHKHGAYLVENAGLRGFSPEEVAAIATLVRFQRGKDPRPVFPPFAELPSATRNACVVLTGILRVGHAIARGPESEALDVEVRVDDGVVRMGVVGSANPDAAVDDARLASGLLASSLGLGVEIDAVARATARATAAAPGPRSSSRAGRSA